MCTSLSKAWESMKPNPVGILNQLVNINIIKYYDQYKIQHYYIIYLIYFRTVKMFQI